MTRPDWDDEPPTEVLHMAGAVDTDANRPSETGRDDDREPARPTVPLPTRSTGRLPVEQPPQDGRGRAGGRPGTGDSFDSDAQGTDRGVPPRRRRRSWLVRLAGGDEDILARAPADRPKFVSMGAVLIGTSAVAAVSAAFAMNASVKLTPVPAVLVGLLWGLVILNLDRMLVVSMVTTAGLRRSLVTAIPRVVLAAVIGAIISMPLVLRIFQPEIDAELETMRQESLSAAQTALNQDVRFAAIPDLEKQEAQLIPVAAGQQSGDVSTDPEVARLREAVAAKEKEYTDAENALICERGGATCGSGVPGRGPIYEELNARLVRLGGERDDLRRQLADATANAQTRINSGSQEQIQVAKSDLTRVQGQLAALRADKQRAEDDVNKAQVANTGLLAQLQALDRLTRGSWMMLAAHGALFLLFLCIEVLPVLMKVLAAAGPPSLYDRLLAKREADSLAEADDGSEDLRAQHEERRRVRAAEEDERVKMRETQTEVSLALGQHRAEAQIEAGKRANDRLAAKQEELATKAIQVWGQVAAARTDEELRYWYERHMAELRRGATERDPGGATARAAEVREQAIPWSDFMAQQATARRTAAQPSSERRPTTSHARVDEEGIYRSAAPQAAAPPDDPPAFATPPRRTPADPGTGQHETDLDDAEQHRADLVDPSGSVASNGAHPGGTERGGRGPADDDTDTWNPDAYEGEVAPPPAAPPRTDR